uniref:Ribosomal protein S7 n=1 Tax=Cycas taitungensis TaxID=54799 RepID=B0BLH1_CYCTA|nr:ribosomal protein S7 [Cycas taitungensis]BAF98435.1 ribosomal protein S7 [Cycas taitungensis]
MNRGGGGERNISLLCARILHYIDRLAEKDEQKQLRDRELAEKDGQKQLHNINSSAAGGEGGLLSPKPRGRRAGTYNLLEILSYIGGLDGKQKQLINKSVNFRTIDGKRTKARAIAYQTFHRPARTERDVIKLLVNAVENIKPICEAGKVRVAGTTYNVPEIVARDRQQTLAIRWILGAAFKRRISNGIGSDKCLSAETLDAHRKRGIARKKRDDPHEPASTNRSFAHLRWW